MEKLTNAMIRVGDLKKLLFQKIIDQGDKTSKRYESFEQGDFKT